MNKRNSVLMLTVKLSMSTIKVRFGRARRSIQRHGKRARVGAVSIREHTVNELRSHVGRDGGNAVGHAHAGAGREVEKDGVCGSGGSGGGVG